MELRFKFAQNQPYARVSSESGEPVLTLATANKVLAGPGVENWLLPGTADVHQDGELTLLRGADFICGAAAVAVDDENLEHISRVLYASILQHTAGFSLHRFWNFVPQINAPVGELDRYMCFCAGRAHAFTHHERPFDGADLPPASAVGTVGGHLCLAFIAGSTHLSPVENPLQVPAYRYPRRYGPRPPSFARAGVIDVPDSLFISGTASIRASESVHLDDFADQARTAIENLQAVSAAAHRADWLNTDTSYRRTVRVYVKNTQHWQQNASCFEQLLLAGVEQFNVVQADICRPELLVEIEAWAAR